MTLWGYAFFVKLKEFHMKLIVGLGNPGKQYHQTRHNVGFDVLDKCVKSFQLEFNKQKFKGIYAESMIHNEKVIFLKPLTYMNLSGESVRPFMDYFKIDLADLVVVYDDLDIPPGKIRLRQKGSAGGHNGIKSLIAHLGTQEFNRIRVGVGRPLNGEAVVHYVLNGYSKEELVPMEQAVNKTVEALEASIQKPFIKVMNEFN